MTNDMLFHTHDRRGLMQDVVTCIRNHTTIDDGRVCAWSSCRPLL
ncbi:hypothetical protein [Komagataeibacter diospyri]|nr:hypothetical protein [Komagataeibacter diospyri]